MEYEAVITVRNYRSAVYYGAVMRNRLLFKPLIVLIPLAVLYYLGVLCLLWPLYPLSYFVLLSYALAAVVVLAGAEKGVLRYRKSEDSVLNKPLRFRIDKGQFHYEIPCKNVHLSGEISRLSAVIELSGLYMAYISARETILLPKAGMGVGEAVFRRTMREKLGDRFIEYQANKKKIECP